MNHPGPTSHAHRTASSGFTLVELTIVVLILAILAALVTPKFSQAAAKAEATQIAATMRVFAEAVQRYHATHSDFPPDTNRGLFPAELEPYLGSFNMDTTPIGGQWDYENWPWQSSRPFKIALSVRQGDTARFQSIDQLLDDGNLSTGGVRRVNANGARLQFGIVRN